jgi:smad nuclear-interacting protein 1
VRSRSPRRGGGSPARRRSPSPPPRQQRKDAPSGGKEKEFWGKRDEQLEAEPKGDEPKEKKDFTNFETSGLLTAETNTFRGVVLKYNEPQDAAVPKLKWRLHGFRGEEELPVIHLHRQSAFLIGKEHKVGSHPWREHGLMRSCGGGGGGQE